MTVSNMWMKTVVAKRNINSVSGWAGALRYADYITTKEGVGVA